MLLWHWRCLLLYNNRCPCCCRIRIRRIRSGGRYWHWSWYWGNGGHIGWRVLVLLLLLMVAYVFLLVSGLAERVGPGDLSCGLVDVEEALGLGVELADPSKGL
jgi:hypothetical protein